MEFERIEVESRDEYREAQEPRGFIWRARRYEVVEVVDRWYEGSLDARSMPLRYFRVVTHSGDRFIIRYHELFRAWSIMVPRELRDLE